MKIFIRTDASYTIGSGHVMRCLTLADALQKYAEIVFVCREFPGHMQEIILQRGYEVLLLQAPSEEYLMQDDDLTHAAWLGVSWFQDANETIDKIGNAQVDWFVVDHYGINFRWHNKLRFLVKNFFVVDDIADRKLDCDLLLDQTFGRLTGDYNSIVSSKCEKLIGAKYALLRPEFAVHRLTAIEKRKSSLGISQILITMGGSDPDNVTAIVLEGLNLISWSTPLKIDVVMGGNALHIEVIKNLASNHKFPVTVSINVNNMAERMILADLAIGAGGSTSWERCCLGLPALTTLNAANQTEIINRLEEFGAIVSLGYYKDLTPEIISTELNILYNCSEKLSHLSDKCFQVTDGLGVERVMEAMHVT